MYLYKKIGSDNINHHKFWRKISWLLLIVANLFVMMILALLIEIDFVLMIIKY